MSAALTVRLKGAFKRHYRVVEVFAHLLVVTGFCVVAVSETGSMAGATTNGFTSQTFTLSEFTPMAERAAEQDVVEPFLSTAASGASGIQPLQTIQPIQTLQLAPGQDMLRYATEVMHSDFPVTALGARWTGTTAGSEHDATVTITVHISDSRARSIASRVLPTLGDDLKGPLPEGVVVTKPVIVDDAKEFWFEVELRRAPDGSSPVIDSIDFITVDSRRSWTQRIISAASRRRSNSVNVVSREEWGADESLRLLADGTELWPAEYADPVAFVVHHTAGTDGGADPAATIRAIYFWHTVVMGWGDIGYNYLIDPSGTIYQGRVGGDGAIGAHTYNDVDHVNYNVGTIGIALLGCFEETPGACYISTTITEEMNAALVDLIGAKAAQLKIPLTGDTLLQSKPIPRIVGHRDLDYTYCPGNVLHDSLDDIRERALDRYRALVRKPYRSQFQSLQADDTLYTDTTLVALPMTSPHILTLTFKNTGDKTWMPDTTYIKVYNGTGKGRTMLTTREWKDVYGRFALNEDSVATGEMGTFTFPLRSPKLSGVKTIVTKLFYSKNKIKRSQRTITLPFVRDYEGTPVSHTLPVAMKAGTSQAVTVTYTNTGEQAWDSTVGLFVGDKKVATVDSHNAGGTDDATMTVVPDGSVDFSFDFKAPIPQKQSVRSLPVELRRNGERIAGTRQVLLMRVDP